MAETIDHAVENPWPVKDDDGYYQSYQEDGRWVNFWQRERPNVFQIGLGFILASDLSGISESVCSMTYRESCNIETNLPVLKPYWIPDSQATSGQKFTPNLNQSFGALESGVRATWIGHATVLAEVDGYAVLCDPIFSQRASPVSFAGPKRYRPPACSVSQLPERLDAVVISHTHYDHMDEDSILKLHSKYGQALKWFVPSGSGVDFRAHGITNVREMVWWQEQVDKQTSVVFTPSNHWSRRGLMDENKALWGSWAVIGRNGSKFWFGGDTAYSDVFAQIGRKFAPFHLAAIPIGAYFPRETMKFVHVNPEEAVRIHDDIGSLKSLGMHWGTFKLTYEYYLEPRTKLQELVDQRGKDELGNDKLPFHTVYIGGTLDGANVDNAAKDETKAQLVTKDLVEDLSLQN